MHVYVCVCMCMCARVCRGWGGGEVAIANAVAEEDLPEKVTLEDRTKVVLSRGKSQKRRTVSRPRGRHVLGISDKR